MKLGQKLRNLGVKQIQVPRTLISRGCCSEWIFPCRGIREAVKYYDDMGR